MARACSSPFGSLGGRIGPSRRARAPCLRSGLGGLAGLPLRRVTARHPGLRGHPGHLLYHQVVNIQEDLANYRAALEQVL